MEDAILPIAAAFLDANIRSNNWAAKQAALHALGSVLEGPSRDGKAKFLTPFLEFALQYIKDPHPFVQETAAWTIGRICDRFISSITEQGLPVLMQTLLQGLENPNPKVAANICWVCDAIIWGLCLPLQADLVPLSLGHSLPRRLHC